MERAGTRKKTLLRLLLLPPASALVLAGGAFLWLHTEGGRAFVQRKVNAALADSGYRLRVDGMRLFPFGVSLTGVTVADGRGVFFAADRLEADVGMFPLADKTLTLAATAGKTALYRRPDASPAREKKTAPRLPALYFKTLRVTGVAVERLFLGASVAGRETAFSPTLAGTLSMDGAVLRGEADLLVRPEEGVSLKLPHAIVWRGAFDASRARLSLAPLMMTHPSYRLEAAGDLGFGEEGQIALSVAGGIADLASLAPGLSGAADFSVLALGRSGDPDVHAEARLRSELLREKGFGDVVLRSDVRNAVLAPSGRLALKTVYRGVAAALDAGFGYQDGRIEVTDIRGSAPDLTLSGRLAVDAETGRATGALSVAVAELASYAELFGVQAKGRIQADVRLSALEGSQAAVLEVAAENLSYRGIAAEKASFSADVPDILRPFPERADAGIRALRFVGGSLRTADVSVKRREDGAYDAAFSGQGEWRKEFSLKGSATLADPPSVRNADMRLRFGKGEMRLAGDANLETLGLRLESSAFPLGSLPVALPPILSRAEGSGTAALSGTPASPEIRANVRLSPLEGSAPKVRLALDGSYRDGRMRLAASGTGKGIRTLTADAAAPVRLSLRPSAFDLPKDGALQGTFRADMEAGPFAQGFLPPGQTLAGRVDAAGAVTGTVRAPNANGELRWRNGAYRHARRGIALQDMALDARIDGPLAEIRRFSATDGKKGRLSGAGTLHFVDPAKTALAITATRLNLPRGVPADGVFSADLRLSGAKGTYVLSGAASTDELHVAIPERAAGAVPELNIVTEGEAAQASPSAGKPSLVLDVKFAANNRIFVRGRGLDAEMKADIAVSGPASAPLANGTMESIRGRYQEFGKRFALEHARLRFQGAVPPSPYLDVLAGVKAGDVAAKIALTGPVAAPSFKMSSDPALPEDEILARVLFKRDLRRLSPFQALQLAQTLRRLAGKGGGGFDPLGILQEKTGLDDLRAETSESGETTVGAGKYVTDKVYLELEKGAAEHSGTANVVIEAGPDVTVESKVGRDAKAGVGIFWKHDY
jgi:translocation and assembly module TamB